MLACLLPVCKRSFSSQLTTALKLTTLQGKTEMAAQNILSDLLNNKAVRMKDPLAVRTKIEGMIAAGLDKLMVITDFDYTLSCHSYNGVRCSTTHGVFEKDIKGLDPDFHKKTLELRDKYIQIEFSPDMSIEEKTPYMWTASHKLIVENKLAQDLIKSLTQSSDCHMDVGVEKETVVLRVGYLNFNVKELESKYIQEYDIVLIDDQTMDVPLLIFNQIHDTFEPKPIVSQEEAELLEKNLEKVVKSEMNIK